MAKTKVLIVGGGKGGAALLEVFRTIEVVEIVGVCDPDDNAPGIKLAKEIGLPTHSDYRSCLDSVTVDEVINVTGSEDVHVKLLEDVPEGVRVIGGHSAKLMWDLLEAHSNVLDNFEEKAKEWQETFDSIPDLISIQDKDFNIVRVNKAYSDIFGLSPKDLEGKKCYEIVRGTNEPHPGCPVKELINTKKAERKEFFEPNMGAWLEVLTTPVFDAKGELSHIVHVAKDISERKKVEEKIKAAKDYAELLFKVTPSGIFTVDKEQKVTSWNKKAEEITGYSPEEVIGHKCFKFAVSPCSDKCGLFDEDVIKPITAKECVIKAKDGRLVELSMNIDFLRNEVGEIVGGIESFEDITDRKAAERAMLESVRMKSNFTSMVSHELRTPLTAIKEGISIVWDGSAGDVNEEQKDFLGTAKRNVDRLARLINDVLDFTKLQSGKMQMRKIGTDIGVIIKEAISVQEPLAKEKGLYIKADVAEGLPKVNLDPDRIIQVITNFANNAFKFTSEGGVTISAESDGEFVVVKVIDTGSGIKEEDLPKLFKEFSQLEDSNSRKTGGTGLGLAISREIVEAHGGRVGVESVFGEGTTFYFSLPIERLWKALVVDDEKAVLDFCEAALKKDGYKVFAFGKGEGVVDAVLSEKPDIIILDMQLPDVSGYEIVGRLRGDRRSAKIPILAISGYDWTFNMLEEVMKEREYDIIPTLRKPFDVDYFLEVVGELAGRAKEK